MPKRVTISPEDILAINAEVQSPKSDVTLNLTGDSELDEWVIEAVRANRTAAVYKVVPVFAGRKVRVIDGMSMLRGDSFEPTFLKLDDAILESENPNFMWRHDPPFVIHRGKIRENVNAFGIPVGTPMERFIGSNHNEASRLLRIIRSSRMDRYDAVLVGQRLAIISRLSQKDGGAGMTESWVGQLAYNVLSTSPLSSYAFMRVQPFLKKPVS